MNKRADSEASSTASRKQKKGPPKLPPLGNEEGGKVYHYNLVSKREFYHRKLLCGNTKTPRQRTPLRIEIGNILNDLENAPENLYPSRVFVSHSPPVRGQNNILYEYKRSINCERGGIVKFRRKWKNVKKDELEKIMLIQYYWRLKHNKGLEVKSTSQENLRSGGIVLLGKEKTILLTPEFRKGYEYGIDTHSERNKEVFQEREHIHEYSLIDKNCVTNLVPIEVPRISSFNITKKYKDMDDIPLRKMKSLFKSQLPEVKLEFSRVWNEENLVETVDVTSLCFLPRQKTDYSPRNSKLYEIKEKAGDKWEEVNETKNEIEIFIEKKEEIKNEICEMNNEISLFIEKIDKIQTWNENNKISSSSNRYLNKENLDLYYKDKIKKIWEENSMISNEISSLKIPTVKIDKNLFKIKTFNKANSFRDLSVKKKENNFYIESSPERSSELGDERFQKSKSLSPKRSKPKPSKEIKFEYISKKKKKATKSINTTSWNEMNKLEKLIKMQFKLDKSNEELYDYYYDKLQRLKKYRPKLLEKIPTGSSCRMKTPTSKIWNEQNIVDNKKVKVQLKNTYEPLDWSKSKVSKGIKFEYSPTKSSPKLRSKSVNTSTWNENNQKQREETFEIESSKHVRSKPLIWNEDNEISREGRFKVISIPKREIDLNVKVENKSIHISKSPRSPNIRVKSGSLLKNKIPTKRTNNVRVTACSLSKKETRSKKKSQEKVITNESFCFAKEKKVKFIQIQKGSVSLSRSGSPKARPVNDYAHGTSFSLEKKKKEVVYDVVKNVSFSLLMDSSTEYQITEAEEFEIIRENKNITHELSNTISWNESNIMVSSELIDIEKKSDLKNMFKQSDITTNCFEILTNPEDKTRTKLKIEEQEGLFYQEHYQKKTWNDINKVEVTSFENIIQIKKELEISQAYNINYEKEEEEKEMNKVVTDKAFEIVADDKNKKWNVSNKILHLEDNDFFVAPVYEKMQPVNFSKSKEEFSLISKRKPIFELENQSDLSITLLSENKQNWNEKNTSSDQRVVQLGISNQEISFETDPKEKPKLEISEKNMTFNSINRVSRWNQINQLDSSSSILVKNKYNKIDWIQNIQPISTSSLEYKKVPLQLKEAKESFEILYKYRCTPNKCYCKCHLVPVPKEDTISVLSRISQKSQISKRYPRREENSKESDDEDVISNFSRHNVKGNYDKQLRRIKMQSPRGDQEIRFQHPISQGAWSPSVKSRIDMSPRYNLYKGNEGVIEIESQLRSPRRSKEKEILRDVQVAKDFE